MYIGSLTEKLEMTADHVVILVLGDVGHSPRMRYHAESLCAEGFHVSVVGYYAEDVNFGSVANAIIHRCSVQDIPDFIEGLPSAVSLVLKTIWRTVVLLITLLFIQWPSYIIVQNPPAIPTLPVVWFVCWVRGSRLTIDWHNYGYTILGLRLGPRNVLVRAASWCEGFFGSLADDNLCVSNAMKEDLSVKWGIRATTHYDRPPASFGPTSLTIQHELFQRLASEYQAFDNRSALEDVDSTRFTYVNSENTICKNSDRSALVISSTSWTADEDFSLLLTALDAYENAASTQQNTRSSHNLPHLLCVITGKGPLKDFYCDQIAGKHWQHVQVITAWLRREDYPLLLGSADLGICLHTSSSGLDLPMKVVDMFGCGLPVCAFAYNCLSELVDDGKNGLLFSDSDQLSQQLQDLLRGFPANTAKLDSLRKSVDSFRNVTWHSLWKRNVLPKLRSPSGTAAPSS